jgi:hypothetical protein
MDEGQTKMENPMLVLVEKRENERIVRMQGVIKGHMGGWMKGKQK